jgi:hypothetical protein
MADESHDARASLAAALPGLARIAAGTWWRTTEWAVSGTAHAYARLLRAATSGESAAELLSDMRAYARGLLEADERVRGAIPESLVSRAKTVDDDDDEALRERGEALLLESADVHSHEHAHPAYARILTELAPDEARILRLLATTGPEPAVDVRSGLLPIGATSQLVAGGLQMIGAHAGARYVDRVPAYLNNLYRLGLIWFSREPLEDPLRYQVLEAQPDVLGALRSAGHGRTVRRSICLTPFGEDFCEVCLPAAREDPPEAPPER